MAAEILLRRCVPLLGATVALVLGVACSDRTEQVPSADEPQPPVQVSAAVDRAAATTGDVITYTVTINRDPGFEVELPETGAEIAGFRIVDFGRDEAEVQGRVVEERWYKLRADLVGSYVLPPVRANFRPAGDEAAEPQIVETSEIFVEVESVLPTDVEATDIRDIKPLRHPASRIPWLWIAAGLALVGVLIGVFLLLRRRSQIQPPPQPAHEVAFAALDALRRVDFDDPEAVRRFYFEISHTLRAYVEGRWQFNATDLTSEEILAGLDQVPELGETQESSLQHFLLHTDQVKFAKHRPEQHEIEETYERALSFVEATRPPEAQDNVAEAS